MSASVKKTEVRYDPCSQSDSGVFFPHGGLDLDKTGHLHKTVRARKDRGEYNSGLVVVSKINLGKSVSRGKHRSENRDKVRGKKIGHH